MPVRVGDQCICTAFDIIPDGNSRISPDHRPAETGLVPDLHNSSPVIHRYDTRPVYPDKIVHMPGEEHTSLPNDHPRPRIQFEFRPPGKAARPKKFYPAHSCKEFII